MATGVLTSRSPAGTSRSVFAAMTVGGAALTVLLRLRFVWTPLTADEGGFLAVARTWRHGGRLYRDVWADRPQGLFVVLRVWDMISFGHTASLRVLALLAGVTAVVSVAFAVRALAGPLAGGYAALFAGVTSAAPAIEGFVVNGELLSAAFSTLALLAGVSWITGRRRARVLLVAGLASGAALSIKQSGVDVFLALSTWIGIAAAWRWRDRRQCAVAIGWHVAGMAIVVVALTLHGALLGWSDWWSAIAGWRISRHSAVEGVEWDRLSRTAELARPILGPLVVITLAGLASTIGRSRAGGRRAGREVWTLLAAWLAWSGLAFFSGGQFHRHYWVILTFPVAAVAAVAVAAVRWRGAAAVAAAVALAFPISGALDLITTPRSDVPLLASDDSRSIVDEHLADWLHDTAAPGHDLYVLCASAAFYAVAEQDPPYPYMWWLMVLELPGARDRLVAMMSSPDRPEFVASYQRPPQCDPTGAVGAALTAHYIRFDTVSGVPIYRRRAWSATLSPE